MIHLNIILLTDGNPDTWAPFGAPDIGEEIKLFWDRYIMGSPIVAEYFGDSQINGCRCHFPPSRPTPVEIFDHVYGCVFDRDSCLNNGGHLRNELNSIPESVIICFISQEDTICDSKDNYFAQTIHANNKDYMIVAYLGALALLLASKLDPKFKSSAEEKLGRIMRRYQKKSRKVRQN
jgi:hypothetical protein